MSALSRRLSNRRGQKRYQDNNREFIRRRGRVQNRKRGDLLGLFEDYLKMCAYCGAKLTSSTMQIDHLVPLKSGGSDETENLVACCRSCNSSKGTKPLIVWLATRPRNAAEWYLMRMAKN